MAGFGFYSEHWLNDDEVPQGGVSTGRGFCISWQNGALGQGSERKDPNGAFVEDVIAAVRDRIEHYQITDFNCEENHQALIHLTKALDALNSRTGRREKEGTEGTHKGS